MENEKISLIINKISNRVGMSKEDFKKVVDNLSGKNLLEPNLKQLDIGLDVFFAIKRINLLKTKLMNNKEFNPSWVQLSIGHICNKIISVDKYGFSYTLLSPKFEWNSDILINVYQISLHFTNNDLNCIKNTLSTIEKYYKDYRYKKYVDNYAPLPKKKPKEKIHRGFGNDKHLKLCDFFNLNKNQDSNVHIVYLGNNPMDKVDFIHAGPSGQLSHIDKVIKILKGEIPPITPDNQQKVKVEIKPNVSIGKTSIFVQSKNNPIHANKPTNTSQVNVKRHVLTEFFVDCFDNHSPYNSFVTLSDNFVSKSSILNNMLYIYGVDDCKIYFNAKNVVGCKSDVLTENKDKEKYDFYYRNAISFKRGKDDNKIYILLKNQRPLMIHIKKDKLNELLHKISIGEDNICVSNYITFNADDVVLLALSPNLSDN